MLSILFGLLSALMIWGIPKGNEAIIYLMVGSLGTAWIQAISYFFGSSKGSKAKDEQIKQALTK